MRSNIVFLVKEKTFNYRRKIQMSKGRRIKTFCDISERPVYREILELLKDKQIPMTVNEIRHALFPLHSTRLNYQTYPPKKVEHQYYPIMTYLNVCNYLRYLHKFGLIKKAIRNTSSGEIEHRSINFEEVHKLFTSPPGYSLDDITKYLKQNGWPENLINEKIQYSNLLDDVIDEMNGIKNSVTFQYKNFSKKKIEKLKIIIILQIAIIKYIQLSKNEKNDYYDIFRRINEIENYISEIADGDINLPMILETEQTTEFVMKIANQNIKEIEENNYHYTSKKTGECKMTTNYILKDILNKKKKKIEKDFSDFLEKTGREMDNNIKMTITFSNGKTMEV